MATTAAAAPQAPQSIGAVGRIIGAIINPRPTFEDIARKPSWLVPLLVLIIVQCAIAFIFSQRVGWRSFMEKQDAENSSLQQRMQQMTPEQREQMISTQTKIAPVIGYVGALVGVPIVALVVAAIFLGIFNGLAGAGLDFKTSFGIVAHSYMPGFISALLGILILYLKQPDQIDLRNLVASNVGAVLSSDAPKWLTALGGSIDVFSFWIIGLLAFGFSVARPKKISMGTGLTWIIVVWAIYVILKVGATALFT